VEGLKEREEGREKKEEKEEDCEVEESRSGVQKDEGVVMDSREG
jgi:hypothetical protein